MSHEITPETPREKRIELQAKINTFTFIENYPCECDKKKLSELFNEIKALKWNYKQELEEINE